MNALKSKTIIFSILLAIFGVVEQYSSVITSMIGQQNSGLLMIGISIIVAVLRAVTTQPLMEK